MVNKKSTIHTKKEIQKEIKLKSRKNEDLYDLKIIIRNKGNIELKNLSISTKIPQKIKIIEYSEIFEEKSVSHGKKLTWTFFELNPRKKIKINLVLEGEYDDFIIDGDFFKLAVDYD